MKKLALTSLLAFMAVSGANAANVIDDNPLYMPKAGHFYSISSLRSHSETTKDWNLYEEFGYGITDKFAINIKGSLGEQAEDFPGGDDEMFDVYGLADLGVEATFRAYEKDGVVADVYGSVTAGPDLNGGGLAFHSDWRDDTFWFDKDETGYTWLGGVRAGYTTGAFTIAGHAQYAYVNSKMFNWGEKGIHALSFGLDGQFVIDNNWNLVAGAEYTGITNDNIAYDDVELRKTENDGIWTGYFGVNYNIDATKYVGAYINGVMDHWKGDADKPGAKKGWGFEDGFGFGVIFGIDF